MKSISTAQLELLRQQFPRGTRVELIRMTDPFTRLQPGDQGAVSMIDSMGTVFVNWDCGSGLGLVFGEDLYRKIDS
jgi:hypothetical protein